MHVSYDPDYDLSIYDCSGSMAPEELEVSLRFDRLIVDCSELHSDCLRALLAMKSEYHLHVWNQRSSGVGVQLADQLFG